MYLTFFQWIQKNTNYVAIQGTKTIEAVVATATTASNGQSVGDISIILPEGLANSLKKSAIAAIDACDGFKKRQIRRDDPSNGCKWSIITYVVTSTETARSFMYTTVCICRRFQEWSH